MNDKLWKALTVVLAVLVVVSLVLNGYLLSRIGSLESNQDGDSNLESRIVSLEENITLLGGRIDDLETESDSMSDEVSDLEDAIDDLEQRISDLEDWRMWHTIEQSDKPLLLLGAPQDIGGNTWRVEILGVSCSLSLDNWSAILVKDDTWQQMSPLVSGTSGDISFVDLDGGGYLSTGDWFTISCDPGSSYRLIVSHNVYGGGVADLVEWAA